MRVQKNAGQFGWVGRRFRGLRSVLSENGTHLNAESMSNLSSRIASKNPSVVDKGLPKIIERMKGYLSPQQIHDVVINVRTRAVFKALRKISRAIKTKVTPEQAYQLLIACSSCHAASYELLLTALNTDITPEKIVEFYSSIKLFFGLDGDQFAFLTAQKLLIAGTTPEEIMELFHRSLSISCWTSVLYTLLKNKFTDKQIYELFKIIETRYSHSSYSLFSAYGALKISHFFSPEQIVEIFNNPEEFMNFDEPEEQRDFWRNLRGAASKSAEKTMPVVLAANMTPEQILEALSNKP